MVKSAPRFDTVQWLTLHDAAAHEAFGLQQGKASLPPEPESEVVTIGRLVINFWERTITQGTETVQLYDKQWAVFAYLLNHYRASKSGFVTVDQLLNAIWDGIGSKNLVRTTIWRLREKLLALNADLQIESVPRSYQYRLKVRRIKI